MTLPLPPLLDTRAGSAGAAVFTVAAVLVVLVLLMGVAILVIRRKTMQKDRDESMGSVYTLHELRGMLRAGEITQQEFERLRDIVTTRTRGLDKPQKPEKRDRTESPDKQVEPDKRDRRDPSSG